MTKLRSKINRFFYNNQNKGIRNLMLFLAIGNVLVYLLNVLKPDDPLFYRLLVFDGDAILHGQVWRLFSYPLVYMVESGPIWGALGLFFYYWCGSVLEQSWGVLRFNFYYLIGILLTDLAALLLGAAASSFYVYLSLFLAVATLLPDQQIRIWLVLPVKMKWLAWIDLGLTLFSTVAGIVAMISGFTRGLVYLDWLLPLVPIVVWLIFFGKQAANILPDFIRYHPTRKSWKRKVKQGRIYEVPNKQGQARFRCTVCGRTELTNPKLEFRYCSQCAGYRCYCEDHIHNHTHITE